jgi:hypothetical protein
MGDLWETNSSFSQEEKPKSYFHPGGWGVVKRSISRIWFSSFVRAWMLLLGSSRRDMKLSSMSFCQTIHTHHQNNRAPHSTAIRRGCFALPTASYYGTAPFYNPLFDIYSCHPSTLGMTASTTANSPHFLVNPGIVHFLLLLELNDGPSFLFSHRHLRSNKAPTNTLGTPSNTEPYPHQNVRVISTSFHGLDDDARFESAILRFVF